MVGRKAFLAIIAALACADAFIVQPRLHRFSSARLNAFIQTKSVVLKSEEKPEEKPSSDNLKKADFIDMVVAKTSMSKKDVDTVFAAALETITEAVSMGKKVTFLGFGTFDARERKARIGRNPKTGEALQIKASRLPGFSASKAFKDKLNNK